MTLYEYQCKNCEASFEHLETTSNKEALVICPACESKKTKKIKKSKIPSGCSECHNCPGCGR